jgi:hypothetical protein
MKDVQIEVLRPPAGYVGLLLGIRAMHYGALSTRTVVVGHFSLLIGVGKTTLL